MAIFVLAFFTFDGSDDSGNSGSYSDSCGKNHRHSTTDTIGGITTTARYC